MQCLAILWLLCNPSTGLAQELELRFEDLPRLISEKNQAAAGTGLLVESARARTGYLRRSYLPTIGAGAGGERFQTGPYGFETQPYGQLEARLNLYQGGRDRLEDELRERQIAWFNAEARRTHAAELLLARRTYWELVSNEETAKIMEEALSQNEKLMETADRRIRRGLATEADRLEFEINRSQLKEDLESLNHAAILLRIRLAAVLGMAPGTRIKTPQRIEHLHDDALLAAAFDPAAHPDVEGLKARSRSLSVERGRALRWWGPSLDLYGGYYLYTLRDRDFRSQSRRDDQVAGLRLSVGLFDGLQSRTEAGALALQAEGLARQRAQRENAVEAEVRVAKEDLRHDHELIHYSEERIEQARRYLARTLEEYERGVKNSPDALAAAQRYLAYRRQYAERRRNYQLTKAALSALLGQ